jgi:hypothetical protein
MKLFIPIFLCHLISLPLLAQDDLTELDKRNGFKNIKMTMHIDSVPGAVFKKDIKEKGHFPAKLYEVVHPDNATIGEVAVNKIEVKTYKDDHSMTCAMKRTRGRVKICRLNSARPQKKHFSFCTPPL